LAEQPPQPPPEDAPERPEVPGEGPGPEAPPPLWQPPAPPQPPPGWQPPPAPVWPPPEGGYPTSTPPGTPGQPQPLPPAYPPPPPTGYPPPPPGYFPPPGWQPPAKPRGPHGEPMFRQYECASWGRRVGAYLLDGLFAFVIPLAVGVALASSGVLALEIAGGILIAYAFLLSWLFYAPLTMMRRGRHNGQTPGKQIVGIRVVRDADQPMSFGWGMLREPAVRWMLIGVIGGFFFIPPLLDLLWPLWDEENRALHDMIVSTHVVRAEEPPPSSSLGLS
jgi:uncharacterized RDD family membrane protein YckC